MIAKTRQRGRPPIYPWDRWFKKRKLSLEKNVHFNCETKSFEQLVYRQAKKRALKVELSTKELIVTIRVQ